MRYLNDTRTDQTPCSPDDMMMLQAHYDARILKFLTSERKITGKDTVQFKVFLEMLILNTKVLASVGEAGDEMRAFLFDSKNPGETLSRVYDLLFNLRTSFPTEYIDWKERVYSECIKDTIGIDVVEDIIPLAQLMASIQAVNSSIPT